MLLSQKNFLQILFKKSIFKNFQLHSEKYDRNVRLWKIILKNTSKKNLLRLSEISLQLKSNEKNHFNAMVQ